MISSIDRAFNVFNPEHGARLKVYNTGMLALAGTLLTAVSLIAHKAIASSMTLKAATLATFTLLHATPMVYVIVALGVSLIAISFFIKRTPKELENDIKAIKDQQEALVQKLGDYNLGDDVHRQCINILRSGRNGNYCKTSLEGLHTTRRERLWNIYKHYKIYKICNRLADSHVQLKKLEALEKDPITVVA